MFARLKRRNKMPQYICESCIRNKSCNDCKTNKGKRRNVEGCGDYIRKLDTRQKIRISGYWKDDKTEFSEYICVVNDLGIRKDDNEIFYYFNNWKEVEYCCNVKKNVGEFIITDIMEY
jgi:hypothetical protein